MRGFACKSRNCESAITERTEVGHFPYVTASPRIVTLSNPGKTSKVPLRLCNMPKKIVTLPPKGNICELQEVKLLRSLSLNNIVGVTAHVNQQKVEKERSKHLEAVDLDDTKLSSVQKNKVVQFLINWQHVFSQSDTDLGHIDLVQNEIHLENEQPFNEPYHCIPPALIQEVREHLKEMVEMDAICRSNSPF